MNNYLSYKLKILSFLCIILVVFIHTSFSVSTDAFKYNNYAFLQYFISEGIARIAVPLFFIISGYLYFFNLSNIKYDYIQKTKKRIKTLIIPYLIVSSICFLFYFLILIPFASSHLSSVLDIFEQSFEKVLLDAFFLKPLAYQLWFLRDLIVLVFITPIIFLLIKYLNFAFILILFFLWISPIPIDYIILSKESILFFSLGSFLSFHKKIILTKKNRGFYIIFTWIFILLLKTFINVDKGIFIIYSDLLLKLSIILGIISIWCLYDIIMANKEKPNHIFLSISQYSFFIYLFHDPIILNILKRIALFFIKKHSNYLIFFYFFDTLVAVILCISIAKILQRYTPTIYNIITGNR